MTKTQLNRNRVAARELKESLPADWLPFKTSTDELSAFKGLIGQDRAMEAVEVGLTIPARGFNIFIAGAAGSGKTTTLVRLLGARAAKQPPGSDLCYVHNFSSPNEPQPIHLPTGQGMQFAKAMTRVVEELSRMVPRVLSDQAFGHVRTKIMSGTHRRAKRLTQRATAAGRDLNLATEEDGESLRVLPIVNGEPLTDIEEYQKLPAAQRRSIESSMLTFQKHLDTYAYARQQLEQDHSERLAKAESKALRPLVKELMKKLTSEFRTRSSALARYLDDVTQHVVDNYHIFYDPAGDDEDAPESEDHSDDLAVYKVNVLVDRSREKGAPVVIERKPSPANLCGWFEYRSDGGRLVTDHSMIRPGCFHHANGGYLLLQVDDLVSQVGSWECLKRALRHKQIGIEEEAMPGERRPRLAGAMRPDPVKLQVKVILVGSREAYHILRHEDDDFRRLFKVLAEFESTMPRNRKNVSRMARFLGQVCSEEGYLPIHRSGFGRLVDIASRIAEHKERLITQWAPLLDLIAEANFYATERGARTIQRRDVDRATGQMRQRAGATASSIDRAIADGTIFIRTDGSVVGQVNGLALYDLVGSGMSAFGVPMRITARVYAGHRGVVNIDREVNLSGALHDKGGLILVGYLGGRYAQEQPLGLSASITFEQSYDEVDGDSASCAELFGLLSALSGCPIRQGIAVTGSVNQIGEIQPIGGVNAKIEGMYRVCKQLGRLTGDQGVLIPRANVRHLMLDQDVIDAVRDRKFHIYAVSTVDEGIEVLTGVPAGQRTRTGWTPDSINFKVAERLSQLQTALQKTASGYTLGSSRV